MMIRMRVAEAARLGGSEVGALVGLAEVKAGMVRGSLWFAGAAPGLMIVIVGVDSGGREKWS